MRPRTDLRRRSSDDPQRIGVARALGLRPKVIICDEPVRGPASACHFAEVRVVTHAAP